MATTKIKKCGSIITGSVCGVEITPLNCVSRRRICKECFEKIQEEQEKTRIKLIYIRKMKQQANNINSQIEQTDNITEQPSNIDNQIEQTDNTREQPSNIDNRIEQTDNINNSIEQPNTFVNPIEQPTFLGNPIGQLNNFENLCNNILIDNNAIFKNLDAIADEIDLENIKISELTNEVKRQSLLLSSLEEKLISNFKIHFDNHVKEIRYENRGVRYENDRLKSEIEKLKTENEKLKKTRS